MGRREFIVAGGALSAFRAMPSTPVCVLTAEQEEGPYYVDYGKIRRDVTEGKPGVPVRLKIALVHAKKCAPLSNVAVDIWHCDASGVYSAFTYNHLGGPRRGRGSWPPSPPPNGAGPPRDRFGAPPDGIGRPPGGHGAMDSTRFLRGVQATDANGIAEFATIYPGWYEGRAIHIHLKVHAGGHVAHTGQLFFPQDMTARIAQLQPSAQHRDVPLTTQEQDNIFDSQHGAGGMLTLNRMDSKSEAAGFVAVVTLAVDPDAIPAPVGMRGPGERMEQR